MKDEFAKLLAQRKVHIFDAHLAILDDPVFMNEIQGIMERSI